MIYFIIPVAIKKKEKNRIIFYLLTLKYEEKKNMRSECRVASSASVQERLRVDENDIQFLYRKEL